METTPVTPREILLLPMRPNDAGALTVGGYLQSLVRAVWKEGEGFSGKRPFGESGWKHQLCEAVIAGGASKGDADQVVFDAIDALFPEPWTGAEATRIAAAALREKADEIDPVESSRKYYAPVSTKGEIGWRPISTAPRDGTSILVMRDIWPGSPTGRATECANINTYVAAWWGDDNDSAQGSWICYMDRVLEPECPIKPTHWMPLPPPPIAAGE